MTAPRIVVTATPVSPEEVADAQARGESVLGQAGRIMERTPPPARADLICTISRYGERLVVPRALAYAMGAYVRAGRPWAVAQNLYWGGS